MKRGDETKRVELLSRRFLLAFWYAQYQDENGVEGDMLGLRFLLEFTALSPNSPEYELAMLVFVGV